VATNGIPEAVNGPRVTWAEIEPIAREHFGIWNSRSDLKWAEEAWDVLGRQGLTSYRTEAERSECVLRLITLRALYGAF